MCSRQASVPGWIDPVCGAGIDKANCRILIMTDSFHRCVIRQTQDNDIGGIDDGLFCRRVFALCRIYREKFDIFSDR